MFHRLLTIDAAEARMQAERQRLREAWSDGERIGPRIVPPLVDCSDGPPLGAVPATPLERLYASVLCMADELERAAGCLPEDPVVRRLHHASTTTLVTFSTALLPSLEDTRG
jgi:hypothetical protein